LSRSITASRCAEATAHRAADLDRGDRRIAAQVVRQRGRVALGIEQQHARALEPALLDRLEDLLLADLAEPGQLAQRAGAGQRGDRVEVGRGERLEDPARLLRADLGQLGELDHERRPLVAQALEHGDRAPARQLGDHARDRRAHAWQLLEATLLDQPVQAVGGLDRLRRAVIRERAAAIAVEVVVHGELA
jgi:hypothetical protein